ncbi:MAG: TetR/AcrR family transcriptional regulator C-terminal domain-containing protein [Eubacterium sp.]|nr:TetR/AcrR family transcriptional regulator C-terminal domain-containing protein [Eubacterium sp.]
MRKLVNNPDKKRVIADAFIQLMQSQPADKITVKMLIDTCGISRPTFYYHFKDIPDVVEYLISGILERTCQACIKADDLKSAIRIFLDMIVDNRKLVKRLDKSAKSRDYWRYIAKRIEETLSSILSNTSEHEDRLRFADMQLLISVFSYGMMGVMIDRIISNSPIDTEALTEQLYLFHQLYQGDVPEEVLLRLKLKE